MNDADEAPFPALREKKPHAIVPEVSSESLMNDVSRLTFHEVYDA